MDKIKRAALYIRVSTEEQARHGYSLAAQLEDLKAYATKKKYKIVDAYIDEGVSARKKPFNRKEFKRLLEDVKENKIDTILFIKLDRWFRSVSDYYKAQEILDAHKVEWETTQESYNTTTTNGRLMLNIKLSVAQNESDMTSDRIKFVFAQKRALKQVTCGSVLLGFKIENKHLVHSDKAPIAKAIFEYYLLHQSFSSTIKWLKQEYQITMYPASLKRLLRSELYIGKKGDDDEFTDRIIDNETFYAVQDIIKRNVKRAPSGRIYLFTGLIRCPSCGSSMSVSVTEQKNHTYIYYLCPRRYNTFDCNDKIRISESKLEASLLNTLAKQLEGYFLSITAKQEKPIKHNNAAIKKKLERLKDLYLNELIDLDTYKKDYKALQKELIPVIIKPDPIRITKKKEQIYDAIQAYSSLSKELKRSFWRSLIDHIDVSGDMPVIFFK